MGRIRESWDDFGAPASTEDGPPTTRLKPVPTPAPPPRTPRRRQVDLEAPDRVLDEVTEPKKPAT